LEFTETDICPVAPAKSMPLAENNEGFVVPVTDVLPVPDGRLSKT
jgi:hypothetical protein